MVFGLFEAKASTPEDALAQKDYARAVELYKQQLQSRRTDDALRLKLVDALVLAGRTGEAGIILKNMASDLAERGYAARSIVVLKKLEQIQGSAADRARVAQVIGKAASARPAAAPRPAAAAPAPVAAPLPARAPAPPPRPATGSGPLVVDSEAGEEQKLLATPLFEGFAPEELEDVIGALRLAQFEPGEILVSEGEPGNSLFILTSGTVRAFVRDASGHNAQVRRLREGDFLGEISLLSGAARTATITAATPVDALELDRPGFDAIVSRHPRVGDVLHRFYEQRRNSAAEAEVRARG